MIIFLLLARFSMTNRLVLFPSIALVDQFYDRYLADPELDQYFFGRNNVIKMHSKSKYSMIDV